MEFKLVDDTLIAPIVLEKRLEIRAGTELRRGGKEFTNKNFTARLPDSLELKDVANRRASIVPSPLSPSSVPRDTAPPIVRSPAPIPKAAAPPISFCANTGPASDVFKVPTRRIAVKDSSPSNKMQLKNVASSSKKPVARSAAVTSSGAASAEAVTGAVSATVSVALPGKKFVKQQIANSGSKPKIELVAHVASVNEAASNNRLAQLLLSACENRNMAQSKLEKWNPIYRRLVEATAKALRTTSSNTATTSSASSEKPISFTTVSKNNNSTTEKRSKNINSLPSKDVSTRDVHSKDVVSNEKTHPSDKTINKVVQSADKSASVGQSTNKSPAPSNETEMSSVAVVLDQQQVRPPAKTSTLQQPITAKIATATSSEQSQQTKTSKAAATTTTITSKKPTPRLISLVSPPKERPLQTTAQAAKQLINIRLAAAQQPINTRSAAAQSNTVSNNFSEQQQLKRKRSDAQQPECSNANVAKSNENHAVDAEVQCGNGMRNDAELSLLECVKAYVEKVGRLSEEDRMQAISYLASKDRIMQ